MKTFIKILFAAVIVLTVAKVFDGPPAPPCNPKIEVCPIGGSNPIPHIPK